MKFIPTIPNFLTIFRVLLIPLILYFLLSNSLLFIFLALALFGISAITDAIDGILARKWNQTSEFGAYFDPLADKILVWSVFTALSFNVSLFMPFWLIALIYIRDFSITILRNYSKRMNIKFKTSFAAKAKTTVQMITAAIIMSYMLISQLFKTLFKIKAADYDAIWHSIVSEKSYLIVYIPLVLTIFTVIFTIYTAIDYFLIFHKNRVFKNE